MRDFSFFQHDQVLGFKFGYHPYAKPSLHTHIYHVDGMLIDTGQSHMQSMILDKTKNLKIDKILLTHHHEDHTGNINALRNHHQCEVFGSELCYEMMKRPPKISWAQKMVWGDRPANFHITPIKYKIETKNFEFQLIPIPGHADDMIALYEPNKKWLFSADLYINSFIGYMLKDESIMRQIQSIKTILELDFDLLFCSHNPQLIDGKSALQKKLQFLENFRGRVGALHQKGYSAKEIFKALNLKENAFVKYASFGHLSQMNMVKSVIREFDNHKMFTS